MIVVGSPSAWAGRTLSTPVCFCPHLHLRRSELTYPLDSVLLVCRDTLRCVLRTKSNAHSGANRTLVSEQNLQRSAGNRTPISAK
jgi:hypothetical protein